MLEFIADNTWRNPIFMLVFFTTLWFLPGAIYNRVNSHNKLKKKKENQKKKIASLYPTNTIRIDKED